MTGAILAGGMSRRMGFNKALIEIDGRTIIERTVAVFRETFDEVLVIANEPLLYERLSTRVAADLIKGAGSLGGIYTALALSAADLAFVAACDMPFIERAAIERVAALASSRFDAAIPFIAGRLHPMHAVYSRRCMKTFKEMIEAGNLRVNDAIARLRIRRLTEEEFAGIPIERSVVNVNTQEELDRARGGR